MSDQNPDFSDFFPLECIDPDLRVTGKEEVLADLLNLLVQVGKVTDRERVFQALQAREAECSCGIGRGVAVPHAETNGVEGTGVAVGISRTGIGYGSFDEEPVKIVLLMVFPPGARATRLQLVARLIKLVRRPDIRDEILDARTASEIREILIRYLDNQNPPMAGSTQ